MQEEKNRQFFVLADWCVFRLRKVADVPPKENVREAKLFVCWSGETGETEAQTEQTKPNRTEVKRTGRA